MNLVTIYTEKNEMEAALTKGFLEAQGIQATITASSNSRYGFWVELDPQGPNRPFDVMVSEKDAHEAWELLKERNKRNGNL